MSTIDQNPTTGVAADEDLLALPQHHLDVVVTPGAEGPARPASLRTVLGAVIVLPLFFLVSFTLAYISATHQPVPHDMALTIAGPSSTTEQVAATITDRAAGAFDITRTVSAAAARDAVRDRSAVGAVIIEGTTVTTVVASGGSTLASAVIEDVGQQVASGLGGTTTVEDVAPLPADDPGGTALFYFLVLCTVGGFLSITAITQAFGKPRTRSLVLTAVGAAFVAPVVGFGVISLFVDFGVTFGSVAAVLGIGMIYTFTAAMLSVLFTRLVGGAAIFLQVLILIAMNFPSAGASVPESMLPPAWQAVHDVWVGAAGFESMRTIMYFDGVSAGRWIAQLAAWAGAAVVLVVLVTVVQRRRAAGSDAARPAAGEERRSAEVTPASGDEPLRRDHTPVTGSRSSVERSAITADGGS